MASSRHANARASASDVYALCSCPKAIFMEWDTHPMCPFHLIRSHYDRSKEDYFADSTPRCPMCARLTGECFRQWLATYELVHCIRPTARADVPSAGPSSRSPHRSQPPAAVPDGVARLSMAVNSRGDAPQASYFGEAGVPAVHSRWDESELQPSGVVSTAASMDQGVGMEEQFDDAEVGSIDMDVTDEFDHDEQDGGDQPVVRPPVSNRQIHFQRIFDRAVSALQMATSPVDEAGNALPSWNLPVDQPKGPRILPSAPIVEPWYKSTEEKAIPRTTKAKGTVHPKLQVKVDGLTPSRWALPRIEPALLKQAEKPKNRGTDATPSSHPHGEIEIYSREAWYATLRAAGLVSCIGTLVKYTNALTSSADFEAHKAACTTAGVAPEWIADFCTDPSANAYFQELGDCTEALANLVMSVALELGSANSCNTIVRRVAWMDHIGIPKGQQRAQQFNSTKGNGPLVGCTDAVIQKMRQDASDKEVLQKDLGLPPQPTPQGAGRGRGRGNAAVGANVQGFLDGYGKMGLGRGRARGRGRGNANKRRSSNRYNNTSQAKGNAPAAAAASTAEPPTKK